MEETLPWLEKWNSPADDRPSPSTQNVATGKGGVGSLSGTVVGTLSGADWKLLLAEMEHH